MEGIDQSQFANPTSEVAPQADARQSLKLREKITNVFNWRPGSKRMYYQEKEFDKAGQPKEDEQKEQLREVLTQKGIDPSLLNLHSDLFENFSNRALNLENYRERPNIRFRPVMVDNTSYTPTSLLEVTNKISTSDEVTLGKANELLYRLQDNLSLDTWASDPDRQIYRYTDTPDNYGATSLPGLKNSYSFIEPEIFDQGKCSFWSVETPREEYGKTPEGTDRHLITSTIQELERTGVIVYDVLEKNALMHVTNPTV